MEECAADRTEKRMSIFLTYLKSKKIYLRALANLKQNRNWNSNRRRSPPTNNANRINAAFVEGSNKTWDCNYCLNKKLDKTHPTFVCPEMETATIKEAEKVFEENKMCGKCFKVGHPLKECRINDEKFGPATCSEPNSNGTTCGSRHHKRLHGTTIQSLINKATFQVIIDKSQNTYHTIAENHGIEQDNTHPNVDIDMPNIDVNEQESAIITGNSSGNDDSNVSDSENSTSEGEFHEGEYYEVPYEIIKTVGDKQQDTTINLTEVTDGERYGEGDHTMGGSGCLLIVQHIMTTQGVEALTFFDRGSTCNLVTFSFANMLGLKGSNVTLKITTVGQIVTRVKSKFYRVH